MNINWLKYKKIYFSFSGFLIVISVFSLIKWGLTLGVDFKGGVTIDYKLERDILQEEVKSKLDSEGIQISSIQKTGENTYIFHSSDISDDQRKMMLQVIGDESKGQVKELQFQKVGPSISSELIKKTVYAIVIASVLILLWVAFQFKSMSYGVSAIVAMLHDTFLLVGIYSLFGHFMGAEADFLFFTAVLTTLSFSVHDTIVVFDRIREISKKDGGSLHDISNRALTETMVRSLNNSFTIIFMLVALILLGGISIKWFAVALLIGTVLGTYSSPFVAVPLLTIFHKSD